MLGNITAEMGRRGYTRKYMCKLLDVTEPTFRGYLRGKPIPSDKLKSMCAMFGKSADYLLENTELSGEGA